MGTYLRVCMHVHMCITLLIIKQSFLEHLGEKMVGTKILKCIPLKEF